MPYALLFLFLSGLLVAGCAQDRRVARVGAWLTVLSGALMVELAVLYALGVWR